eukprot:4080980-Amphidinium_carterae.2
MEHKSESAARPQLGFAGVLSAGHSYHQMCLRRKCVACDWDAGDACRGLAVSAEDAEARCK